MASGNACPRAARCTSGSGGRGCGMGTGSGRSDCQRSPEIQTRGRDRTVRTNPVGREARGGHAASDGRDRRLAQRGLWSDCAGTADVAAP
eukprot:159416-Hanusia_phi.AAC.2